MSNFVKSSRSIIDQGPINLDEIIVFEKFEDQNVKKEENGRYQIHFLRNERSVGPRSLFWKYKDVVDRDADFDALVQQKAITLN